MKVQPEWRAIHEVADKYRPYIQKIYIRAFKQLSESVDIDKLAEVGFSLMEEAIDWSVFRTACEKNYDAIGRIVADSGTQASFYLSRKKFLNRNQPVRKDSTGDEPKGTGIPLETVTIPVVVRTTGFELSAIGSFNMRNPKAIEWATKYVGDNIREVENVTREAVRAIIADALKYGGHPRETAREIRQFIGLTEKQVKSILNYQRKLDESGRSVSRVNEMVDSQVRRLIRRRAETIARTETIDAANQGQMLHWEDMAAQGYLDKRFIKKKWSATPDERLCPVCKPLDGEIADIDKPFSWGGMRPTRHPKCRCAVSLVEINEEE